MPYRKGQNTGSFLEALACQERAHTVAIPTLFLHEEMRSGECPG